jgi:hypothetical protein
MKDNRQRPGFYTPVVAVTTTASDAFTAFAYSSSASRAYTKYSAPGSSPSISNGDAGFTPASYRLMSPVPFPESLSCVKIKRCLSTEPGGSVNEQVIPPAAAPACALKEAGGSSPMGLNSSSASPAMTLVTFAPMKALRPVMFCPVEKRFHEACMRRPMIFHAVTRSENALRTSACLGVLPREYVTYFITARPKTPELCSGDEARKTLCEKIPPQLCCGGIL